MSRRLHGTLALGLVAVLAGATGLLAQSKPRKGFEIEITEPANQEVVFGKTKIAAAVRIDDPRQIDRVEFMVGDDVVFVDREPPWECFYDFGETSRSWVVRAIAHHVEGPTVSDVSITQRIDLDSVERVNRVILWIAATDKQGNLVTDLRPEEIRVFEDDKPQQIIDFYVESRPISMAILMDSSGSMQEELTEVHAAAGAFVETLRDEDRALVIDFEESVFLIQDLTGDRGALRAAISSTEAIGGTALYDALHAAYRKIGSLEGRKALVILSDGEDTASRASFKRVQAEARQKNALIYAIALGGQAKSVLRELSEVTGGRFFVVDKATELGETYAAIAEELRKQYFLSYSTANGTWDGRWIKLRAECTRPGITLRARRGYFAVRGLMLGG